MPKHGARLAEVDKNAILKHAKKPGEDGQTNGLLRGAMSGDKTALWPRTRRESRPFSF